ncbi:MmgE/PrpD family protein [Pigmentiphaga kullae]|uniref:2-methylcitrate dehydratase PrpD n=1 Tax=Pigmentiphaga kullae TaxID=151784 RepID=A0A4Q7N7M4_9BURK|nr:MmgE/PrpD family protein [Pigmentiphaga kullae]RZS78055.1 2-methylcitrate dehydratase PrpD [Pigmentiphaga kullae]
MSPDTLTARLASHVIDTPWDALPPAAVLAAKHMALDTLAVAWAGTCAPGIPPVREAIIDEGGKPQSAVWATHAKIPARSAAFLNSAAAAALDFDGMRASERGSVHSDSVVLPAALAVAEQHGATGRELVAALVLGNDIVTRLGAASALPHRGWYQTSIYGIMGAAAAAARLMKLDAEQTMHAFGIAVNQACSTQLPNIERSLVKRYSSAFAAQGGVLAALLAARGITAARQAFEGRFGFYELYQPGEPDRLLEGLGVSYPHVETGVKRFPSCACNHTAIEAALHLSREQPVPPSEIAELEVTISPYVHRLVGAPFDPSSDPQVAAQFSVQYSVAAAMLRGRFGVGDIEPEAVLDPAALELARRVAVHVDEAWGNSRAATVVVRTRAGQRRERHVAHIPGSREAPLAEADRREKALDCLRAGIRPLGAEQAQRLVGRVLGLDGLADAGELLKDLA